MTHTPRRPPLFLLAMTLLAVGSLLLGIINQIGQQNIQSDRNQERIRSDLQSCERGNLFRAQAKEGFVAVDDAIQGVLDVFLGTPRPGTEAQIAALKARLEEPLSKLDKARNAIQITDCQAAVPGATKEK